MASASYENPKYTVTVLNSAGNKYNLTGAITDLSLDEPENGIAQKVSFKLAQIKHDGSYLTSIINVRDRIFVYANTGSGNKEVFRGYIWTDLYKKHTENVIEIVCYDKLIYLMESEEYKYFASGKSTKSIFKSICESKGIPLTYTHESIKHAKIVIRGTLADAFETDLLENVRKKTGKRGVIRDTKGKMEVFTEGTKNSTVYKFYKGEGGNILESGHEITMDGMTTKVIILGQEKDNKQAPIKATVKGDTSKYGTLQKVVSSSDNDKLSTLKKEAQQTIKDDGKPKINRSIRAVDNPWVRKGDKIHINDGYVSGYAYVKGIKHDASNKTMDMEIRMA